MSRVRVRSLVSEDIAPGTPLSACLDEKLQDTRKRISSVLPVFMIAQPDDNPFEYSIWAFISRRASLVCSIEYWSGSHEYSRQAIMGCIYTAILEGRKRVENISNRTLTELPLKDFKLEGVYPKFSDKLEEGLFYGFTWQRDPIPREPETTNFKLRVTPKTLEIRERNLKLYDTKLDHQHSTEDTGVFKEEILLAIKEVESIPGVTID